jgi:Bacteriophage Sf6, terminase small subunit-like
MMSDSKVKDLGGRPTKYTQEMAEKICQIVETHPHGIRRLTKMFDWMPSESVISEWRARNDWFQVRFLEARQKQTHLLFENAIDEVEELEEYKYHDSKAGATRIDTGIVAMKKLIASHKLRHAAQINPKEYASKRDEESNNPQDTLSKIQSLVADLNKDNKSEI